MSDFLTGSLDLTKMFEQMNAGHSAFEKSEKNGHIYVNIKMWLNDEQDQFGNDASVQLNSHKNASQAEQEANKKLYIGNMRRRQPAAPAATDTNNMGAALQNFGGNIPPGQSAPMYQPQPAQQQAPPPVQQQQQYAQPYQPQQQQPAQAPIQQPHYQQPAQVVQPAPGAPADGLPF